MVSAQSLSDQLATFLGTDQPETCRKCGARTDFDELTINKQLHRCFNCDNQYFVEFEDDESHEGDKN